MLAASDSTPRAFDGSPMSNWHTQHQQLIANERVKFNSTRIELDLLLRKERHRAQSQEAAADGEAAAAGGGEVRATVRISLQGEDASVSIGTEGTFPLHSEAMRVFQLADLDEDGNLAVEELVKMTGFAALAERLLGRSDVDMSGALDIHEWVDYIEGKGDAGAKVLQLYENVLTQDFAFEEANAKQRRASQSANGL